MDGIKMDLKETRYGAEDWIHLAQERDFHLQDHRFVPPLLGAPP